MEKQILIGDYDDIVPQLIEEALKNLDYDYTCYHTQDEKSTLDLANREKYEAIFLRNSLPLTPGETYEAADVGLSLLKKIREGTLNKDSLIFLMSGDYAKISDRAKKYNVTEGIQLPIDLSDFEKILKENLSA